MTPKITGKAHENQHLSFDTVPLALYHSRVEIIRGVAPVRPGPYMYGYLSPSRSRPETGFVAIVLFVYKIIATSCLILCKVTFASPPTFHIFVEMCVLCVLCVCLAIFPCRNHKGHCPGETGSLCGYLSPSRSGPETGFVAIVFFYTKSL